MFPSPPEELAQMAVSRYGEMVYRLAFSHTGSRQDADDIYQEVFLRLVRRPNVFEDEEHLRAWLIRVTVNCCNSLWRSPWKRRTVPLSQVEETAAADEPELTGLTETLQRLSPKDRTVIHLFYYEDLPVAQISRLLGERESTIRSRLTRARQRLKLLLEGGEA